jgi:DNA-binding CsgD family transcriptional regulator/tetratricopeptide (TPR) repeat protein
VDQVPRILGREAELAAITELLGDLSVDVRGAVLEGEAGIGKSTVWAAAVEMARAGLWTVLSTRGNQSETGLSFSGLSDLLDPVVDGVLDKLPEPQRLALEVALLRRAPEGEMVGPRELAAAVLGTLRALSVQAPVLLAIDDVQWVDQPTLSALQFALRRLDGVPLRVLATRRTDGVVPAAPLPATIEGLRLIPIGPVDAAVVRQMLTARLDLVLSDRVVDGLVAQTGGNPFWALELAATTHTGPPGAPVSMPQSLAVLVSQRLDGLPGPTRQALLAVSALPQPSIALASRALASVVDDPTGAIDAAVTAGVLAESDGRLWPSHPLLGSAALEALPPVERTQLHARLASIVEDDEQRARHTARAARECPDEAVAVSLDAGAGTARSRGAFAAAAELAEQAVTFTPPDDGVSVARRHTTVAELYSQAGDIERAEASAAISWRLPEAEQRRVLPLLVEATYWLHGTPAAQEILIPLLDDEALDAHTRAVATALAADVGDGKETPRGVLARAALDLFSRVEEEPDPFGMSTALVFLALARLDAGEGISFDAMDRVAELQRDLPHVLATQRAEVVLACWYRCVDDLDRSRTALHAAIADARDHGEDSALAVLYGNLALSEVWAGQYLRAQEAIGEGWRHWSRTGFPPLTLVGADVLLRLLTDDIPGAWALIAGSLAVDGTAYPDTNRVVGGHLLGLAALLQGDAEQAVTHLSDAYTMAHESGRADPGRRHRLESDLGQALVLTGRLDDAAALAKEQLALGERTRRPTVLGVGLRIQGLVLSARGDLVAATETLRRAVAEHERSPLPLELGRSLLALAQTCRRRKLRSEAVQVAQAALECFVGIGATAFVRQAQAELDRSQRSRSGALLTGAERQVADLVAGGASNREVAAHLFTSVRTVEGHLAAIYRKLGIRSRTELTRLHSAGDHD